MLWNYKAVYHQHSRANLKLNGKKLYGADGWAVRELLKAATFLRAALDAPPPAEHRDEGALSYDVSGRVSTLASNIVPFYKLF